MDSLYLNMLFTLFIIFVSFAYYKLAKKYNITDVPNERSSHQTITIRGGGIIFPIAIIFFFLVFDFQYPYFLIGLILTAIISFLDDIFTLKNSIRIVVHLVSIVLIVYQIEMSGMNLIWFLPLVFFATGLINIFNFMDGINGLTGLYATTVISAMLYVNYFQSTFIDNHFLLFTLISLLVFCFYNVRKKALFFAGDIGSLSIGLIILFSLGTLITKTENFIYIFFILVYLLDGGITILERFFIHKENIFKPHKKHLYQLLVDKKGFSHLKTAGCFAISQAVMSASVIYFNSKSNTLIPVLLLVALYLFIYILIKASILKK
ncbi:UDP-GlcNAc--UDP-phosphate GlcNAc-1-phosphate transferase [Cellulophaga sp. HaHa_2_95]|nr:UDP-GlcNAc--UDP-phosphate GlcNAc-1-phosphate transferase [Cellulophaga sp. HaHa_2_95]QXP55241.1 UDP-GlcNAc--UDP-phosphate GlcNAc-1-phosphate transferase [Cellulophaga sp. HaHa_2_95]